MSDEKKKSYQIDLIYTSSEATKEEMTALHDELVRRGHTVSLKAYSTQTNLVEDILESAKDHVQTALDAAGTLPQKVLGMIPLPKSAANAVSTALGKQEAPSKENEASPFAEIGPAAVQNDNRAIVVTNVAALKNVAWDAYRIGLLPHTELNQAWTPSQLDAIVTPHGSFRAYLESVHWAKDKIFEGGWLTNVKSSASKEELKKKFGLSSEQGPCLLILAGAFNATDLQTIMLQLSTLRAPYQPFFYYGDSTQTAETLRSLACRFGINARMFGRNKDLADFLAIADLAVASQADADFSKLEPLGIPTVIINETAPNALSQFLAHNGAALSVQHPYELAAQLAAFLDQSQLLANMQAAARTIADGASVVKCADAIEQALATKGTTQTRNPAPLAENTGFETIGTQTLNAPAMVAAPIASVPAQPNMLQPTQPVVQAPMMPTAPLQPQAPLQPTLVHTPKSYKEAHHEYTQLLLIEKDLDRSLDAASNEVRKWEERLDLARQNNNDKLVNEAMIRLKSAQATEMALFQQKDEISQRKSALKKSAQQFKNGGTPSPMNLLINDDFDTPEEDSLEKEFKALQRKQQIENLKSKMGLR